MGLTRAPTNNEIATILSWALPEASITLEAKEPEQITLDQCHDREVFLRLVQELDALNAQWKSGIKITIPSIHLENYEVGIKDALTTAGHYMSPAELSRRAISYESLRLIEQEDIIEPSYEQIGKAFGVDAATIEGVLLNNQKLEQAKFRAYAENNSMDSNEFIMDLLKISRIKILNDEYQRLCGENTPIQQSHRNRKMDLNISNLINSEEMMANLIGKALRNNATAITRMLSEYSIQEIQSNSILEESLSAHRYLLNITKDLGISERAKFTISAAQNTVQKALKKNNPQGHNGV